MDVFSSLNFLSLLLLSVCVNLNMNTGILIRTEFHSDLAYSFDWTLVTIYLSVTKTTKTMVMRMMNDEDDNDEDDNDHPLMTAHLPLAELGPL